MDYRKTFSFAFKRAREQLGGLFCSNYFVSYPRAGRTWTRNMLHEYGEKAGAPILALKEKTYQLDTLPGELRRDPRKIIFSHDVADHPYIRYLRPDNFETLFRKEKYKGKKVFLMLRHPGDVAASHFNLLITLQGRGIVSESDFPQDLADFLVSEEHGVAKIASYYKHWIAFLEKSEGYVASYKIGTYENFRANTEEELAGLIGFFGIDVVPEVLKDVVERNAADFIRDHKDLNRQGYSKLKNAVVLGYKGKISSERDREIDNILTSYALPQYS